MYLHIGQGVVVPMSSVVGIFDLDNTTGSYITRGFLKAAEERGMVEVVSQDLPKSFVICSESGGDRVYLSQLSSQTLLKRCETMSFE
ncbi:MAG: DUF370 domain-containing protein [Oscillospiraceae bacterium]|nr:DUF370 domain-containing protein [Oscillospiraceae bacterium]